MELFASTVVWHDDDKLTVYDKTQGVQNVQRYLCSIFDMKSDELRVMSPYAAFIYNILGVPLAAGVLYPFFGWLLNPMVAAAAMSASSLSVIANALRLRTAKLTDIA